MKQTVLFTITLGIIIAVFTGMADSDKVAYTSKVLSLPDTTMELSFWIYDGKSESEPVLRETRSVEVRDSRIDLDFEPGILPPGEEFFIDILSGDEVIASREPLMRPEEPMAVGLEVGMSGEDLYIAADAVGIGTTTPAVKLDVQGGVASYQSGGSFIYLNPGASGSTINYSGYLDINETSGYPGGLGTANRLLIDGSGNVGIGSSAPAYKLDVDGTARVTGFIMPTGAGANRVLTSNATGTATWQDLPSVPSDNVTGSGTATRVAFWNAANTISSNANLYWDDTNSRLGIGTDAPAGRLAVRQNMTDISTSFTYPHLKLMASNTVDNTGFVGITFAGSTTENYGWSTGALRSTSGQSDFIWKHHSSSELGTEYMRISSTGNVGIGTASPSALLDVSGQTALIGQGNTVTFPSGFGANIALGSSSNITSGRGNTSIGHANSINGSWGQIMGIRSEITGGISGGHIFGMDNVVSAQDAWVIGRGIANSTTRSVQIGYIDTETPTQPGIMTIRDYTGTQRVGIGTIDPSTQLHTTGGVRFAGIGGSGSHLTIDGSGNITRTTISGTVSGSGTNNYISRWTPDGTTLGNSSIWNDGTDVRVIQSSASPVGARFYVQGAPLTTSGSEFLAHIRLAGGSNHYGVLRVEDGGAANALGPVLQVQKYGTGPAAVFTGGDVGIGTTNPEAMLDVRGNSAFGTGIVPTSTETENIINILSGSSSDGATNGIAFMENTSGFGMKLGYDGTGAGAANKLAIYSDTDTEIITFQNGGNVGLGVATPAAQLHTSGTVRFEGIGGAGSHLTIDASGNLTRTTISSSTPQWEDAGIYKRVIGNDNVRAYEAGQEYGLYGRAGTSGTNNYGVYGYAQSATNDYGVYGYIPSGISGDWAVYGYNSFQTGFLGGQIVGLAGNWAGAYGDAHGSASQRGTLGDTRGYGVWGSQGTGSYAGYFEGNVTITGALQANGIGGSGSHLTIDASGNITRTTISGGVSGSGTTNYIPKWSGSSALGNSRIMDNGTAIRMGDLSGLTNSAAQVMIALNQDGSVQNASNDSHLALHLHHDADADGQGVALGFGVSTSDPSIGAKIAHIRVGSMSYGDLAFYTKPSSGGSYDGTIERMRITSGGNLGIGTTAPSTQLHTTGGVRFAGIGGAGSHLTIDATGNISRTTISGGVSGSGSSNYVARWTGASSIGTGTLYDNGTNVGINITSPQYRTDIVGGTTSGTALRLRTSGTGSGQETILRFTNTTVNDASDGYSSYIAGIRISPSGDQALAFGTSASSVAPTERMRLDQNGNLGIGTTAPSTQLHTTGGVRFAGIGGAGSHLTIDATGNISRTTISGGSSYWTDNTSYISANTITDGYSLNIYDDFDAAANGSRLYLTGYSYSATRASLIRAIKTGNSATSTGHSAIYGSSDNYGASYWGHDYASCGVRGVAASYGQSYTAGVAGYRYDGAYGNSAGVFGAVSTAQTPTAWGALGFQDASLNEYGGYFNGNAMTTGSHYLTNTNTRILQGAGNSVRMQTNSGYIDVGPQNTTWAHIYTDRPSFYFNKELYVLGNRVWHDGYHPSSGVTGSGTSGRAARWTGATSLGNSAIYDNGSNIAVGTSASSSYRVYGYYSSTNYGYLGASGTGAYGYGTTYGVRGTGGTYGVYGNGSSYGVRALGGTYGVYASGTSYAGYFSGDVRVTGRFYDSGGNAGTSGQVLSSTGTGTQWVDGGGSSVTCSDVNEGFETGTTAGPWGDWANTTGDDEDWERHSGSTTSSSTGPTSASVGTYYIYCETSSPCVSGDDFYLQADVTLCSSPSIEFDYHMYFNTYTDGTLQLQVSTTAGLTWGTIWSAVGNHGTAWQNTTRSLASYAGDDVIIRYVFTIGSLGSPFYYDCALDDITIYDMEDGARRRIRPFAEEGGTETITYECAFDVEPGDILALSGDGSGRLIPATSLNTVTAGIATSDVSVKRDDTALRSTPDFIDIESEIIELEERGASEAVLAEVAERKASMEREYSSYFVAIEKESRIEVNADATYGEIRKGDMLTLSDTPGHARVLGNDESGQLVGIAMENLESGTGRIAVLIKDGYYSAPVEANVADELINLRGEIEALKKQISEMQN